ncbi:MAG: serine hydrolase domain-containing protein [Acidimicrobiales bacterium]
MKSYGTANVNTGRPLTPDDYFRLASITKTFTGTAILQLIDRGRLSLEDPIDKFVPGLPYGEQITIRHLLEMRSGVYDWSLDPDFVRRYKAHPLVRGFGPADALKIILRNPDMAKPPGQETEYNNANYTLLGLVLEKVTGRAAGDVITNRVIRPLGLGHTSFPVTPALPEPFVRGYLLGEPGFVDVTRSSVDATWTAGNMISNVPDLVKYTRALGRGALLSPQTQAQRLQFHPFPLPPGAPFAGYGLGIMKIGDWIGHGGDIFGYSNDAWYLPSADATITVTVNKGSIDARGTANIWTVIAEHLYPGSISGAPAGFRRLRYLEAPAHRSAGS